jgi:hypothetical protein
VPGGGVGVIGARSDITGRPDSHDGSHGQGSRNLSAQVSAGGGTNSSRS